MCNVYEAIGVLENPSTVVEVLPDLAVDYSCYCDEDDEVCCDCSAVQFRVAEALQLYIIDWNCNSSHIHAADNALWEARFRPSPLLSLASADYETKSLYGQLVRAHEPGAYGWVRRARERGAL